MYDSHSHLTKDFYSNIDEIVSKSKEDGLKGIVSCSTTVQNFGQNLEIGSNHKGFIYPTIGIHPENAKEFSLNYEKNWDYLVDTINENRNLVYAIGECGMDYFHSTKYIDEQKKIFEYQILMSLEQDLPLIIHTRNSKDQNAQSCILDSVNMLKKYKNVRGVCHCFTGNLDEAKHILDLGFYLGFTNIVTYKSNTELQKVADFVIEKYPNQILFETDCPYLPPAHKRGERSKPSDVKYVYDFFKQKISEEKINSNFNKFINYEN